MFIILIRVIRGPLKSPSFRNPLGGQAVGLGSYACRETQAEQEGGEELGFHGEVGCLGASWVVAPHFTNFIPG